jgi:hypothetical protein
MSDVNAQTKGLRWLTQLWSILTVEENVRCEWHRVRNSNYTNRSQKLHYSVPSRLSRGDKRTYLKKCSKDLGLLSPMTPDMTCVPTIALVTSLFLLLTKKNYVSRKLFPSSVSATHLSIPCAHRSCREVNLLMLVSSYGITFAQRG